jgi:hypothetical protein
MLKKLKTNVEKINEKITLFEKNNKSLPIPEQMFNQIEDLKHQAQYGKYFDYVISAILSAVTVITIFKKIYNFVCPKILPNAQERPSVLESP